jgi:hypothetical protein
VEQFTEMNINYPKTLALITGNAPFNFFSLEAAVYDDAKDYVGRNPAFIYIADRNDGKPWNDQEKKEVDYMTDTATRDAARLIADQIADLVPENIKRARLFKQFLHA